MAGSIELTAALRYTGTRLLGDGGKRARIRRPGGGVLSLPFSGLAPKYQRLSDVLNIRSGRHDHR
ncbi:hypothetical protein BRAS3809_3250023 [Bradyrhizobium sp. STM 3809]|nr:hypothetical protein BRAS3809_3250023 [Bradyrhizobium sp. STM 3809]